MKQCSFLLNKVVYLIENITVTQSTTISCVKLLQQLGVMVIIVFTISKTHLYNKQQL